MTTSDKTRYLRVTMPDGSRWDVPVDVIARSRAEHYQSEFGDDIDRSLAEDTLPLFGKSKGEIYDWAGNNMNWSDVAAFAIPAPPKPVSAPDYEEGWMNGKKEIITR